MDGTLELIGSLAIVFAASCGIAYALTRLKLGNRVPFVPAETPIRLSAASGSYRSRVLECNPDGWVIAAPLQRDAYVPLRVGESVVVQAPAEKGLWMFRSEVRERRLDGHVFVLAKPERAYLKDRRSCRRDASVSGQQVLLNGSETELSDLSSGGARVLTTAAVTPGDRAVVRLAANEPEIEAWILDCAAIPSSDGRRRVRLCFAEALLPNKTKLLGRRG